MDENDKLIALFSTRVRQLLLLVEKLRKENKALSDEVALRDKSLEEMGLSQLIAHLFQRLVA